MVWIVKHEEPQILTLRAAYGQGVQRGGLARPGPAGRCLGERRAPGRSQERARAIASRPGFRDSTVRELAQSAADIFGQEFDGFKIQTGI